MNPLIAPTASLTLAAAFVLLVAWRYRTKPPGQRLALVAIAAALLAINAADWVANGSGWSAAQTLIWVVGLTSSAYAFVAATQREHQPDADHEGEPA